MKKRFHAFKRHFSEKWCGKTPVVAGLIVYLVFFTPFVDVNFVVNLSYFENKNIVELMIYEIINLNLYKRIR